MLPSCFPVGSGCVPASACIDCVHSDNALEWECELIHKLRPLPHSFLSFFLFYSPPKVFQIILSANWIRYRANTTVTDSFHKMSSWLEVKFKKRCLERHVQDYKKLHNKSLSAVQLSVFEQHSNSLFPNLSDRYVRSSSNLKGTTTVYSSLTKIRCVIMHME